MTSDIKRRIDALWTEFCQGGITNPLAVIDQISFLIHARLLDLNETRDENREMRTGEPFAHRFKKDEQHLRWSRFRHLEAAEMLPLVQDEVFRHFRTTSASGATFSELMKDAKLMIQKPELLAKAVNMVHELPLTESGAKGDLYEYLLSMLTTVGTYGQFRTPRHIARFMVDLVEPNLWDKDGNPLFPVVGDPSCGTGGFLVSAMEYLFETYPSTKAVFDCAGRERGGMRKVGAGNLLEIHREHIRSGMLHGFDFDVIMLRFAAINLLLHGVDAPEIHCQNTLGPEFLDKFPSKAREGFDLVLSNPPYEGTQEFENVHYGLLRQVKTKKTELLFIALILRMLKEGGRAAVIVPDGVLSGFSREHLQLRQLLVDQNRLEAVISLPSGVFKPYADDSTGILVFTKGGHTESTFFYDVQADGRSLDYKREPVGENDLPDCLARWRFRDEATDTDRTSKAFFVSAEEIRESAYDLSQSQYKELVYETEQYDPPRVILGRINVLNEEIAHDISEMEEMLG